MKVALKSDFLIEPLSASDSEAGQHVTQYFNKVKSAIRKDPLLQVQLFKWLSGRPLLLCHSNRGTTVTAGVMSQPPQTGWYVI